MEWVCVMSEYAKYFFLYLLGTIEVSSVLFQITIHFRINYINCLHRLLVAVTGILC